MIDEITELAERHGNARRSEIIAEPAEPTGFTVKVGRKKVEVNKPRFVKVDTKKGILTQLRKMTRGCTVVERDDKFVFVCDNGKFYKTPSSYKGPLSDEPTAVLFQGKTSSLSEIPLVAVWKLDGGVYANLIPWESSDQDHFQGQVDGCQRVQN